MTLGLHARYRLLLIAMGLALLVQLAPGIVPASAATAETAWMGTTGHSVRTALFDAQLALTAGDTDTARQKLAAAAAGVERLGPAFTVDPAIAATLTTQVAASEAAIDAGDPVALAAARSRIWTTLLGGARLEALAAIDAGDAATASDWLLLREFRPTTRFARPNADASLAVQQLAAGEITPEAAHEAVDADLLDTYQGLLDADLGALQHVDAEGYAARRAELAGLVEGYWGILADAYAAQFGPEARTDADAGFAALVALAVTQPATTIADDVVDLQTIEQSFRAAPLSDADQTRRAGQLDRYLNLVHVEYGRGVKHGEVLLEVEIQEAQAFMAGARASFNDLRLTLADIDPETTASVDAKLAALDTTLAQARSGDAVMDAGELTDQVNGVIDDLHAIYPPAWLEADAAADFDVIVAVLDQLEAAVRGGDYDQAESLMLEAYAIYEVGPEKRLMAFAPDVATETEAIFWQGAHGLPSLSSALADEAPLSAIREIRGNLDASLEEGRTLVGAGRPADGVVIFNAATIVFREGLEAVLILMSLMASMIGANRYLKRPLAMGAGLALVATALLFVLARELLLSLSNFGEKLEAIVSLIAIGVLLIIMNWFFHKVYWTKWISGHHERRRAIIGAGVGQVSGLILLGFTSVFREGAETVLFLQALVIDAGTRVVIEGTLLGLLGVAIIGLLVIVMQKKLPHKTMLKITGLMIALVLVTMVGSTVRVMQVVGWMPITPIEGITLPYWLGVWFGVYATWEGVVAQIVAVTAVIGSYYLAEGIKIRKSSRTSRHQVHPAA